MSFLSKVKFFLSGSRALDSNFFEDLEDILIESDLGASLAVELVQTLKKNVRAKTLTEPAAIRAELHSLLLGFCSELKLELVKDELNIFLLLGVNGVGKTTSCAKLAQYFVQQGATGILAACDTFRAAAIDQLKIHGTRLGLRVVAQEQGADAAAVFYDALSAAQASKANFLIADSAGRMHTREDLVRELTKIDRVISGKASAASYRKILVLDGTTGQNALQQAEIFSKNIKIDGLIVTKLDSAAKGGAIISLGKTTGIPTAFIGTGESYTDLKPFKASEFLQELIGAE